MPNESEIAREVSPGTPNNDSPATIAPSRNPHPANEIGNIDMNRTVGATTSTFKKVIFAPKYCENIYKITTLERTMTKE